MTLEMQQKLEYVLKIASQKVLKLLWKITLQICLENCPQMSKFSSVSKFLHKTKIQPRIFSNGAMKQFFICKRNGELSITFFWAYNAPQPCNKSSKILFTHEVLQMYVYNMGRPYWKSSSNPISISKRGISHYGL